MNTYPPFCKLSTGPAAAVVMPAPNQPSEFNSQFRRHLNPFPPSGATAGAVKG